MHNDSAFPLLGNGLADWIMALAGVVSIGVSIWAIIVAFQSLKAAQDANRTSADAVADTKETGKKQVRAYLNSAHINLEVPAVGARVQLLIHWRNLGQTPATAVQTVGTLEPFEGDNPHFADPEFTSGISTTVVAAGEETRHHVHTDRELTAEAWRALRRGEAGYLLAAKCKYLDVFNEAHVTTMRARLIWSDSGLVVQNEPYGNEMT